ncbi:hypothetical protein ARMA_0235 [Ardenticatena maritima]|uniref:Lipoprotein n=1 Tax=Ardenticatena maritima TaxID=872965 RepID=A0A0M8K6N0_9CHLR|nr:hypothetical protein [Ardenticatena maritima]KPL87925.1 hypothetical protein SE16_10375 [Ardenticatena maritima]GAP61812.1 hypothetical protein ARMA_0235 [Ardenticatena maritima]
MKRLIPVVILAILAASLLQCESLGGATPLSTSPSINLGQLIENRHPDRVDVSDVVEADFDEDGEAEWLVVYRYDPTLSGNFANAPSRALMYDAVSCEFPEFVRYNVPTPDNDYLGESQVQVRRVDFLKTNDSFETNQEIVFSSLGGYRKVLAIYRFRDEQQNPCVAPTTPRAGFQLLGYFQSNFSIIAPLSPENKRITVWERTAFERSQLAVRRTYEPIENARGETYLRDDGSLVEPVEQSVDFVFGLPRSPSDSPYPEKAVAAFYLYLNSNKAAAKNFLMPALQENFENRHYGMPVPVADVASLQVQRVSYRVDMNAENLRQPREVTIDVLVQPAQTGKVASPGVCSIRWRVENFQHEPETVVEGATPTAAQPNDLEWRLAEIVSVSGDGCQP